MKAGSGYRRHYYAEITTTADLVTKNHICNNNQQDTLFTDRDGADQL
jgi:hypothetical protein